MSDGHWMEVKCSLCASVNTEGVPDLSTSPVIGKVMTHQPKQHEEIMSIKKKFERGEW